MRQASPHTVQSFWEFVRKLGEVQTYERTEPLPDWLKNHMPKLLAMKERFKQGDHRHTAEELRAFREAAQWVVDEHHKFHGVDSATIQWPD